MERIFNFDYENCPVKECEFYDSDSLAASLSQEVYAYGSSFNGYNIQTMTIYHDESFEDSFIAKCRNEYTWAETILNLDADPDPCNAQIFS